ncbi:MAG TPA: ATP-binding protein [Bryobacteraceae bacterium]|jgi:anti-sigma regulatory factor (Ser/Thr protein kinase)
MNEKIQMVAARKSFRKKPHFLIKSNRPGWLTLAVSPALESKDQITECFRPHLNGLPRELIENLLLAVDELVSNAMEHGCGLEPDRCVDVSLIRTDRLVLIYVRDDGEGFSIGTVGHAAVNNPPDDPLRHTELRSEMGLRPGGFGIMLAKKVADELLYNQHGNAVLLIKYLDSKG